MNIIGVGVEGFLCGPKMDVCKNDGMEKMHRYVICNDLLDSHVSQHLGSLWVPLS